MNKTEANLERYKAQLKARGYDKLIPLTNPPKNNNDLMNVLAKEGNVLLQQEALAKAKVAPKEAFTEKPALSPAKKLEQTLGMNSKNPYIRARIQVLKDLATDRRDYILKLESEGHLNDRRYTEFVKMVATLGDRFSNNP